MNSSISKLFLYLFVFGIFWNFSNSQSQISLNKISQDIAMNTEGAVMMAAEIMAPNETLQDEENMGILAKKRIKIINLGPVVNWKNVDYAPTISADGRTLFFVSARPGSKLTSSDDYSHDFWASTKKERLDTIFSTPYNIDTISNLNYLNVNTKLNEGAASIAADKQTLYFTACDRSDGLGNCDLYRSIIEGDKWGRPVNLGKNVNSDKWDSQPSISPDQKRIYFVSTRPGPHSDGKSKLENMDIWFSDWDEDTEEWKPAQNLEALNTDESEQTPFIAADNTTLFFSSDGHKPNVGKMDFYVARQDGNTWSKPELLPEPINTPEDDMFITLPASGDVIYFSSRRQDLAGYQGNLDVFMAFVPSFFKAVNVFVTVADECSDEFIPATITVKNPITGRTIVDSINFNKPQFQFIASNTDYGDPKDSIRAVKFEITAFNPKYGSKTVTQLVEKPGITENPDDLKVSDEIKVKITLGQRPVIAAEMAEAEYVTRAKAKNPKLATYRGLVMNETKTWDLYPLLNYVFFDVGGNKLPDRYILFSSPEETVGFSDTTILGGTLDKYYHILNIYGYRMTHFPTVKIEIVGCNDGTTSSEKRPGLSQERANFVFEYLKNIWKIDPSRMKVTARGTPALPTNFKVDTIGIQENRRVEILCEDWNVMKPVFDRGSVIRPQPETMDFVLKNGIEDQIVAKRRIEVKRGGKMWSQHLDIGTVEPKHNYDWRSDAKKYPTDEVPFEVQLIVTTNSGKECASDPIKIPVMQITSEKKKVEGDADSTLERYNLILFPFDRFDAGPINERIMRDYVYERCRPTSNIQVYGHTDVVGMYDHNQKLSEKRSNTVRQGILKQTNSKVGALMNKGLGEEEPLYKNDTPEGRFYNRTVQVVIRTPMSEYDK